MMNRLRLTLITTLVLGLCSTHLGSCDPVPQSPTVDCPDDIIVAEPSNTLWVIPTAVDSDGTNVAVTCDPSNPASMVYRNGDNYVTCQAFDSAGNRGECNFKITLVPEECTFTTLSADVNKYVDCATALTADGLSTICYRLAEANEYNVFVSIWNQRSDTAMMPGMIDLDMVDGETTATGPISGTKPTAGFNDGQQSMCITRMPSSVVISFNNEELWSTLFEPEDVIEVGFASSDDAEWIVQKVYGPQDDEG
ncbi:uncharacterized protein [Asterias amurensis]|uniref:uncharacterized protein isoform X2 n=1 Tax=Asterias amurensis TaxID=7602 RepID=UPI003AB6A6B7